MRKSNKCNQCGFVSSWAGNLEMTTSYYKISILQLHPKNHKQALSDQAETNFCICSIYLLFFKLLMTNCNVWFVLYFSTISIHVLIRLHFAKFNAFLAESAAYFDRRPILPSQPAGIEQMEPVLAPTTQGQKQGISLLTDSHKKEYFASRNRIFRSIFPSFPAYFSTTYPLRKTSLPLLVSQPPNV